MEFRLFKTAPLVAGAFTRSYFFRAAAIDEGAVEDAAAAGDLERASAARTFAVAGSIDADVAAAAA